MAQKDYVKRGRAPKKKAAPPPSPTLPWLRLVLTLALVAGFGYFLWSISQDTSVSETIEQKTVTPVAVKPANNDKPLPKLLDDEYSYPTQLEQNTVEIDRAEQQKSEKPYLMQCGSFRKQQQADSMRAKMALQGLEAQVRPSDGSNGRWYRVILGPYDYKRDAETDRHVIQRIGIGTCQIWFWNLP